MRRPLMLSEVLTQAEVDHERGTRASPSRPEQQPDDPRVDVGLLSAASEQEAASNRNGKMDGQTAEWGSVYDAAFFGFDFAPLIILGIAAILVHYLVSPRSIDIESIFQQQIYISALYHYPFAVSNRLIYILSIGLPILLISFASMVMYNTKIFVFGALALFETLVGCALLTTIVAKIAGFPRPCFLSMCGWDGMVCTAPPQFQQQARESFPSKESSFLAGAFAMLYICLVHQRRPMIAARFFRQIILVPLAAGAIYISLTRVFDGYNRVEDVYMGWSIGVLMAMASTSRPQQNKRARALKAEREAAPEGDARRDSVEWLPRRFDEEVLCERSDHAEVFQDMF